jgi:tetratricopeptide (TPR) repeat protein
VRTDKKPSQKADKKAPSRAYSLGVVGYSKKSVLLEEAITHMNAGKYGRSSAALKELLSLDPQNTEARRLFATLHLRLGSLVTARQAFEALAKEAIDRQDLWLAESLLREYLVAGPRCVPFLELLAHVHDEKGDAIAAVAELGKAIDILLETPDSDNPKKPSQLYAKVRELASASPVALQFASLFDIQTGELLVSHPSSPAEATTLEVDASLHPQGEILVTTEAPGVSSDEMPWEQLDEAPPIRETLPHIWPNPAIELLDVPEMLIAPAPVDFSQQDLKDPLPESTELIQETNRLDQEIIPSISAEPLSLLNGHRDDEIADLIVEHSPFVEEGLSPHTSEQQIGDVGSVIVTSVGSPGLPSPMPWEQIENATIKIEDTAPSMASLALSEAASVLGGESIFIPSALTQPERASEQLSSPAPVLDMTEARESIFAAEPSTIPTILPEPEVSPQPVANSSPTAPFSWNTIFDGAWKFAEEPLSPNSSAALSTSDAMSRETTEEESERSEPVTDLVLFAPSSTSIPEPPVSFSDPELLPDTHPSIVSEVNGSVAAATAAIGEPDVLSPTAAFLSEAPVQPEEPPTFSSDATSSHKMDAPAPPLSELVEPAREPEPVSFSYFTEPQPVAPFLEASAPAPLCSEGIQEAERIQEAPPIPDMAPTEPHEMPVTLFKVASTPPLSATPSDAPLMETASRWNTGEVEVQPHRPSEKKRNWDKEKGDAPLDPAAPLPGIEAAPTSATELSRSGGWESVPSEAAPVVQAVAPILEKVVPPEDTRPEWVRASESITFVSTPPPSPETREDPGIQPAHTKPELAVSVAASAVDVLFDSTGENRQIHTQDRQAPPIPRPRISRKMARVRNGISSFIGSCFSTTRSMVLLCVGLVFSCVVLMAIGVGVVGLAWIMMEAPPSSTYQNLTASPPQPLTDSTKNGYFLLLGFDVSGEQNPIRAGYARSAEETDSRAALSCMLGDEGSGARTGTPAHVVHEWFTRADPMAQLKPQAASIRLWAAQESLALKRYQQWLSMPFEDAGYGKILSPNCGHILLAHRLYLAEGFGQDINTGLGRLENDMASWRTVMGQSKTLMMKMLAVTAVQDDTAIASGLLTRQDLDETAIGRLGKLVRPLDQVESSLRWPMQSHLVWGTNAATKSLKNDKPTERPLYVAVAAAMPLPVQRRSNDYADYYEAASKAVAEGRYTNLPKPSSFIRTSAASVVDYVANPIEHIIGIEPLPSWDPYVGRTVETDARLRLASLQAWIRQGAQEGNVVTRLAKAGQTLYDPFTGLPMLVDQRKGVLYSVGRDGKDQEGDPQRDVAVTIPKTQSVGLENSRSVSPPRSK